MALYNNKKQEKLFHLHDPKKSTSVDCDPIKDAFSDFACEKSYILAQPTGEFNCIGCVSTCNHKHMELQTRTFLGPN